MSCVAETASGRVEGRVEDGLEVFRGIPYAAPPLGALRFAAPRCPKPWSGTRAAHAFGPDAPQPETPLGFDRSDNREDEDCLTLNVWTPAADAARRPVMVWIHGGGFSTGGANRAMYEGAALAREGDLVFVSINYRLGVLGLLTHPALRDEASGVDGNWALLDQRAALEWVRDNIAAFGGDPEAVTLFGESAGGASTALQCVAPGSKGLFARAIVQSASPEPISREQSLEASEAFFRAAGVEGDDIAQGLRALSVEAVLEAHLAWADVAARGRTAPRPCLDGVFLTEWPNDAAAAGATADIDLIVGSNRDEAKIFLFMDPRRGELEEDDLLRRVTEQFDGDAALARRVVDAIRAARSARGEVHDAWEIFCALFTDRMIRVPSLRFLEAHSAAGGRGRSYLFDWESQVAALGACHGLEIPFCLGTLGAAGMASFAGSGERAERLMETMRSQWIAFARADAAALSTWPPFDAKRRASMVFGPESGAEDAPREAERALLAEVDFADESG